MSSDFPYPNLLHNPITPYYIIALCEKLGIYFQHIKALDLLLGTNTSPPREQSTNAKV
jgi:hypothetical protein